MLLIKFVAAESELGIKATFGYLLSFFPGDGMMLGFCRAVYSMTVGGSRRGLSRRRPETLWAP